MNTLHTTVIDSPLGEIRLGATNQGLCMLEFDNTARIDKHFSAFDNYQIIESDEHPVFKDVLTELNEYFNKERTEFSVPIHLIGTEFQIRVWQELQSIQYGATRTYQEQSIALGDVKAIRALANANGQNRISIIVPCHRIIGTNGNLTGYAGEIWRKKYLLELESQQRTLF